MDKLIIPNGGFPLLGDDFAYMQDAQSSATNAVLRTFAEQVGGNMVVSGCKFSLVSSTYHISNGWVMIDYELVKFNGGDTGITDPQNLQDGVLIELYVSTDSAAAATRTMANNSTQNVWQRRQARLVSAVTGFPNFTISDAVRLEYLVALAVNGIADISVPMLDFENNWQGAPNFTQARIIRRGRMVLLKALLEIGTIVTNGLSFTKICTIQDGFRPAIRQYFLCPFVDSGIGLIDINTNGEVYVKAIVYNSQVPPSLLDLSAVRFDAA